MNLLDKLTNLLKPGLVFLLIPFFFACNDPTELGLELEQRDENITLNDTTLILPASSLYIDSLRTDPYSAALFGRYYDNIYGEVRAIANHGYRASSGVLPGDFQGDSLQFESAVLTYSINGSRTRSVISGEEIAIYESTDTIFSNAVYLADRSLKRGDLAVTNHTFSFDPEVDTVLNIPLQEYFGRYLFSLLSRAGEEREFQDSLVRGQVRLNPLVLVPGANNQGIYSLDLQEEESGIAVNMKSPNNTDTTYTYYFRFNSSTRFTSIETARNNGELLSDLQEDYDSSTAESDFAYFDMIYGINPIISLEPLINLYRANDGIIFNSVRFTLGAEATESSYIDQISQLRFFFTESDGTINATAVQNNQLQSSILLTETSYTGGSPTPLTMNYNEETIEYTGNMTLFAQILGSSGEDDVNDYLTRNLVILSPAGIGTGRTSLPKSGIKLSVYYSTINE